MKRKFEKAEQIHDEMLEKLDDESQMLEVEEEFSDFRIRAENELLVLKTFVMEKRNISPMNDQTSIASSSGRNTRLPKLIIEPFDGNPLNSKAFYDKFICTIDGNAELSNVEKISYLLSLVKGAAVQTLKRVCTVQQQLQTGT